MIITSNEERENPLIGGRNLGVVLEELALMIQPGISTGAINAEAEKRIREFGDVPVFKNYTPEGAPFPFPAALCVSVNDEVVHGIPRFERILRDGDIVSLDLGLAHNGIIVDSALTVPVGKTDATSHKLMETTRIALFAGIGSARPGNRIGDISNAIEEAFKGTGFGIVKILGGHGVGREVHEEPWIPNVGHPGTGMEIVAGMVLALEPIANAGKQSVKILKDGYTYVSRDGSRSSHTEHTILIEENETIVVTQRPSEIV